MAIRDALLVLGHVLRAPPSRPGTSSSRLGVLYPPRAPVEMAVFVGGMQIAHLELHSFIAPVCLVVSVVLWLAASHAYACRGMPSPLCIKPPSFMPHAILCVNHR